MFLFYYVGFFEVHQSQREGQNKQTTINQLNQDQINLQQQITNLTQAQTQTTQTNNQQQETIKSYSLLT